MTTVFEFPDRRAVAEEAAAWLIRLDADPAPTATELQALKEWLARSPAHREELKNLAALWGRLNVLTELAVPLGHANRSSADTRPPNRVVSVWWRGGLPAAMLVVIVVVVGAALHARWPGADAQFAKNGLYATAVGQQQTTMLPDGSKVVLNTNSQIKVDYQGRFRNIHLLQGEALFTVAKDKSRPFRVYAGNGRIEALGTAFAVYLNGTAVSVAVTEGRVSLASVNPSRADEAPVEIQSTDQVRSSGSEPDLDRGRMDALGTLAAGHVATIRTAMDESGGSGSALEGVQAIAPDELAQRLAWRNGMLMFSGERLEQVVKEFERYTTVSIEIPDEKVRDMRIGGRFPAGETDEMFDALEANFNLRVIRLAPNRVEIAAAEE